MHPAWSRSPRSSPRARERTRGIEPLALRRRHSGLRALCVVTLSASCALPAPAQTHSRARDGVVASIGLGLGSADAPGSACVDIGDGSCSKRKVPRRNAPAGYVRVGAAVLPNLVLGGEVNAWYRRNDDIGAEQVGVVTVNAVAQWYPLVSSGAFVSGGLGVGRWQSNSQFLWSARGAVRQTDDVHLHTNGVGYQIGAGYDVRVARSVLVTPYVTLFGATNNGAEGEKLGTNVVHGGIGLTWQ
jgi:hypothetical protein